MGRGLTARDKERQRINNDSLYFVCSSLAIFLVKYHLSQYLFQDGQGGIGLLPGNN